MSDHNVPSIKSWDCSFYNNNNKKWKYGKLNLYANHIKFLEEVKVKEEMHIKIIVVNFSNVIEIKKAKSTLVYSCIVIGLNGQQVWFSSFVNREEVFNNLEHFWRGCLLDGRTPTKRTTTNQELLNIAYETQDVLVDAATTLHLQGKQLTHATHMMDNIHNDITVAERITGDIESWVGAWRVKGDFKNLHVLTQRDESPLGHESIEYPVLYAMLIQESHKTGQILFRNDNMELLNDKSEVVHSFVVQQISEIKIHSPWDITLVKRNIGKHDISVHLTSTRMSVLLKTLKRLSQCQFDFDDPPVVNKNLVEEVEEIGGSNTGDKNLLDTSDGEKLLVGGGTVQKSKQTDISKEDASELSKVLNNMKTLALDVGVEQDTQLKQIDSLNQTVDRANARVKATDWRVKKAT